MYLGCECLGSFWAFQRFPLYCQFLAHDVEWTYRWVIRVAHSQVFIICHSSTISEVEVASATCPQNPKGCKSALDSWWSLINEECWGVVWRWGGFAYVLKSANLNLYTEPYVMFWASCRISGPAFKSKASPLAVEAGPAAFSWHAVTMGKCDDTLPEHP